MSTIGAKPVNRCKQVFSLFSGRARIDFYGGVGQPERAYVQLREKALTLSLYKATNLFEFRSDTGVMNDQDRSCDAQAAVGLHAGDGVESGVGESGGVVVFFLFVSFLKWSAPAVRRICKLRIRPCGGYSGAAVRIYSDFGWMLRETSVLRLLCITMMLTTALSSQNANTTLPTGTPTLLPTDVPTLPPTGVPTVLPTDAPTALPTDAPTAVPTVLPTDEPPALPTNASRGALVWGAVLIVFAITVLPLLLAFCCLTKKCRLLTGRCLLSTGMYRLCESARCACCQGSNRENPRRDQARRERYLVYPDSDDSNRLDNADIEITGFDPAEVGGLPQPPAGTKRVEEFLHQSRMSEARHRYRKDPGRYQAHRSGTIGLGSLQADEDEDADENTDFLQPAEMVSAASRHHAKPPLVELSYDSTPDPTPALTPEPAAGDYDIDAVLVPKREVERWTQDKTVETEMKATVKVVVDDGSTEGDGSVELPAPHENEDDFDSANEDMALLSNEADDEHRLDGTAFTHERHGLNA